MRIVTLLLSLVLLLCTSSYVQAITRYVKSTCTNGIATYNPGADTCTGGSDLVYSTINNGVAAMSGGDILDIRAGTYAETLLYSIWAGKSGTASQNTILRGHAGETVIVKPTSVYPIAIYDVSYVTIDNMTFDAATSGTGQLAFQTGSATGTPGARFITLKNSTVKNSTTNTCIGESGPLGGVDHLTYQNVTVTNCVNPTGAGGNPPYAHGIYVHAASSLIERCEISGVDGYAIHLYTGGSNIINDVTIRYNYIHNNGTAAQSGGAMLIANGNRTLVHNNLLVNNTGPQAEGIEIGGSETSAKVVHNTLYNNTPRAAIWDKGNSSTIRNNIIYANGDTILAQGFGTPVISNNLTTNPSFVNAAGNDFSLSAGSAAINFGIAMTGFAYNGTAPDAGAHESLGVASASVESGAANTLRVNWENNVFPPIASCTAANFTVRVEGASRSITSCTIVGSNRTDIVFGGAAVTAGQSVQVDYTAGTLRDSANLVGKYQKAFSCTNCATVQNNTGAGAATPTFSSAVVENATPTVVKVCAATNDPPMLPATGCTGLSITNKTISTCNRNSTDNKCFDATVSVAFAAGAAETVAYDQAGGNVTSSGTGNPELEAFTGKTITNNVQPAAPTGLTGHWKFDETTGTSAADSSGSGNAGTLQNFPASPWVAAGLVGGALDFDGVNDEVTIGSPSALNLTGEMTAVLWVKFDDTLAGTFGSPFLAQNAGCAAGGQYWLDVGRTDGKISTLWADTLIQTSTGTVVVGKWYHIAFVRSGSTGNWTLKLYINNVLDTTTAGITTNPNAQQATYIGGFGTCTGIEQFDGILDDVRIYNTALSAAEISALFAPGPVALSATVANATPTVVKFCATTNDPPLLPALDCTLAGFSVSAGHTITDCDRVGAADPDYKCLNLTVSPAFSSAETARTLAYDPSLGNVTDSKAGNPELALFTALAIANNVQPGGTVNLDQETFRFECWGGTEASPDCTFATDSDKNTYAGGCFKLRISIDNEGTSDKASTGYTFRAQKNGAGGYLTIPNTCATDGICFSEQAPELTAALTTEKLTADPTNFVSGGVQKRADEIPSVALGVAKRTEMLGAFCLGSSVVSGDFWDFEIREAGGTSLNIYTDRPRVTVGTGLGLHFGGSVSGGMRQ